VKCTELRCVISESDQGGWTRYIVILQYSAVSIHRVRFKSFLVSCAFFSQPINSTNANNILTLHVIVRPGATSRETIQWASRGVKSHTEAMNCFSISASAAGKAGSTAGS
jgi:hypothetical protein